MTFYGIQSLQSIDLPSSTVFTFRVSEETMFQFSIFAYHLKLNEICLRRYTIYICASMNYLGYDFSLAFLVNKKLVLKKVLVKIPEPINKKYFYDFR